MFDAHEDVIIRLARGVLSASVGDGFKLYLVEEFCRVVMQKKGKGRKYRRSA